MTDTTEARVRIEDRDGVTYLILNRPDAGNSLNLETSNDLRDAVEELGTRKDLRVVVFKAEGKRFCVGGDLGRFREAPQGSNLCYTVAEPLHTAIRGLEALPVPVIARLHGAVGGGGVGVVLAADIIVMAESAVYRMGYTGSGLSPDTGVSWELPHRAGMAAAMDLVLTNRRVSAAESVTLGLASRAVPDDQLDAEIDGIITSLLASPKETLAETKRLMRASTRTNLITQLDDEARTIGRIGDTDDAREAIEAFLEKRKPKYSSES
jgi:2-(1,2-epoxy-1,2-dihydrophenyl)acetyl-CoA isomerase